MSEIEYKIEGLVELPPNGLSDVAVMKWIQGNGTVLLHQGSTAVRLDANQLALLARCAGQVIADLTGSNKNIAQVSS